MPLRLGAVVRKELAAARLYLCTPDRSDLGEFIEAVCRAGVDIVQLREKGLPDRDLLRRAEVAREAAQAAGALFILNDRPDLALACAADGVHVGQDDVPPAVARRILGPDAVIGLSTHAPAELGTARREPVDYVSVGPVVPTPTKPGRPGTGRDYVRTAALLLGDRLPFFVTGGASPESLPDLLAAGASRFVVVRALTEAADPVSVVRRLREMIDATPPRRPWSR
ncbi:MAG: thiamine phosphate synthase [Actinomycetota bacterium]|nr:thiamine phosphate synthase [Actinomycetota bacterium]